MGVSVAVRRRSGVVIVELAGVAAADVMETVAEGVAGLLEDERRMVVDLDGLTMIDRDALRGLLTVLEGAARDAGSMVLLACPRSSARRLLRAWRSDLTLPVFADVETAVSWQPTPATTTSSDGS